MTTALILTSTFPRHRFVVNRVAEQLDVVGVWQEEKSFTPERYARSAEDERIIARHFEARDVSESEYFGGDVQLRLGSSARSRRVTADGCNQNAEIEMMRRLAPDVVLVFGTGILRRPLIDAFEGRILNLHLGLSPYYRGAGTNFWPLVNREPEYVGATVHYLDAGIDTGPIVAHVRPEIRREDGPHDIGNRTISAAADLLAEAAAVHHHHGLAMVPQAGAGRLYQRKHFGADAVRQLYQQFERGMIDEYLQHKAERDTRLTLVTLTRLDPRLASST
jgi:folate-dependent phosphoribosylglycinamide formyltransferase PurN